MARKTSPSLWMCSRGISPRDLRPSPRLTQSSNHRFRRSSLSGRLRVRAASVIPFSGFLLMALSRRPCSALAAPPKCAVGGSAMPPVEVEVPVLNASEAEFDVFNDLSRASTASGFVSSKSPYRKQPHSLHG
jgi:hypothetical protein